MKSFSGTGIGTTAEAIRQATVGLIDPKTIIVFASLETIEEASELLMKEYPNSDVLGIMGSTYNNGQVVDSSNFSGNENRNVVQVMALFDDAEVACGVLDGLDEIPLRKIKKFNDDIESVHPNPDNTICIAFTTDNEEKFVSTVKTVLKKKKIELVGGSVSGMSGKDGEPFVLVNGKKYYHASAYIIIKNKVGGVKKYRNDTYVKDSDNLMQITKVGTDENTRKIIEADGKRIDKLYMDRYGLTKEEVQNGSFNITVGTPLAVVIGENTYVSSIAKFDQDGSANTYRKIREGGFLTFMKMGDYNKLETDLLQKIKKDMGKISFIFTVDCLYRFLVYSGNGYLNTYLKGMASLGNHVGYISVGEQDSDQHFNQTMVCVAFE